MLQGTRADSNLDAPPFATPSLSRTAWRAALLALDIWAFSSGPAVLGRLAATPNGRFLPGTVLLVGITVLLVATWGHPHDEPGATPAPPVVRPPWQTWAFRTIALVLAVLAARLLFDAARDWLGIVLTSSLASGSGDMLPVVQESLLDLVRGRDPYAIHYVPWAVPLPYGPVLWLPYLIPFLLRADLRVLSVFGQLFIPASCLVTAVLLAARGRLGKALVLIALAALVLSNGQLRLFISVAHTPSYWPLLLLFSVLVAARRPVAASVVLGLLVGGRSTLLSVVPIGLIAAWHQERRALPKMAVGFAAAAVLPFLPFAIWDFKALEFGMVGSYVKVVKGVVWHSADGGVLKTFGLTGFLLAHGWQSWVEASQLAVEALVCAAAWRPLRRGASPLPWAALALLGFSMTSLWPVYYFYFDVFLLLACAMLAEELAPHVLGTPRRIAGFFAALSVLIVVLGGIAANAAHPDYYTIDVASERSRWRLSGFGQPVLEGERRFCWVEGHRATVLLGRTTRRPAAIRVDCRPFLPSASSSQTLQVVVNGVPSTPAVLPAQWESAVFRVSSAAWQVGLNKVDLYFGYAVSPRDAGVSAEARPLAAAVEHVALEPLASRTSPPGPPR